MSLKFNQCLKKVKNKPLVIIGSVIIVFLFGLISNINELATFYDNIDRYLGGDVNKFDKNEKELNILIFPFKNYSGKTGSNISFRIYEMINDIKNRENLENLNIKFYSESILYKNNDQLQKIGKELNADFIVSGSYEISENCNSSICIYDFSFINVKKSNKITDKANFNSILENEKDIIKPLEFYIYYYLGLIELFNGGDPNKAINLLEKARIYTKNNYLKFIVGTYSMILKYHKHRSRDLLNLNPQEAGLDLTKSTYGLKKDSPIFVNGFLNASFYLNSLKFNGEYIKWEQYGAITDSLSPKNKKAVINIAKIYSNSDKYLGLIYIFMDSSKSYYLSPKSYIFDPLYRDPQEMIFESIRKKDSLQSFPGIDYEIYEHGVIFK